MDLEILEGLALAQDRAAALAQLLPGSEDHDYFRALDAQHRGALADADAILAAWPQRHGTTPRYERLRLRQVLCRVGAPADDDGAALGRAADDLRDRMSVSHWHEAEVAEVAAARPTRLPDGAFDGIAQLQHAAGIGTDLAQVTDEGCQELVGWNIDPQRRRVLLGRIGHTPHPAIVDLVADDLAARGSSGFGALAAHAHLTRAQLDAVAEREPSVRTHAGWITAVLQRTRPPAYVDLELDRDARDAYLRELWTFVAALPPASNSLKAHVLWHLLDAARKRDRVDHELFAAYMQLPRTARYALSHKTSAHVLRAELVQPGADFRDATGLAPAGDDEALVRDLVRRDPDDAARLTAFFDREWLEAERAAAALTAGATGTDAERATFVLGPARAAALRDAVELTWCAHNPTRFTPGEPIALAADVKNVAELVVKVFRVDPIAYFEHHKRDLDTDLDLDGLAATDELVLRYAEAPIRRVRRAIELPMCARPGTYVIDLIGNGTSSRALVRTGRLRHVARVGAPGHVVTVVDELGAPLPGARAWVGDREYTADARGELVVPFSTSPARVPMLLAHGEITSVQQLELHAEHYALAMHVVLEREALTAGRTARAIVRLALAVAGHPASLALVKRASWDVTLTDRHGVAVTKSHPLGALTDGDALVLEWPLGDECGHVALAVRGTVEVVSEQREVELVEHASCAVATMHRTHATEALYLARTAAGWVVSALGKTGEPRARRPVTVGLTHRWSRVQRVVELATDDAGRVELGPLDGIDRIAVTLGAWTQAWHVGDAARALHVVCAAGEDIALALPPLRDAGETIARASLVELRGTARMRHVDAELAPLAGGVAIPALPPGQYELRAPGLGAVGITVAEGARVGAWLVTPGWLLERSRLPPVIAALGAADGELRIALRGATPDTRVHVIATRFAPARVPARWPLLAVGSFGRADRPSVARYVSGRELGDEYRYILDRRAQARFPGILLERPSLLLHPWARRASKTDVSRARPGGHFDASPAPAPHAAYASRGGVGGAGGGGGNDVDAYAPYEFLAAAPVVRANLVPAADGTLAVPLAELGDALHVMVQVDDPAGWTARGVALPETPLAPRDLRLRVALAADRHATQTKAIAPLRAGGQLVIEDLATAKIHLLDSLERAHAYLLALRDDEALRELAFVARWHALPAAERAERYSKYACHELHLFLYAKDRAFFDAVVRPTLVHKRVKTFLDCWLLDEDLRGDLEPAALARLNAVERALLAWRLPDAGPQLARLLGDEVTVLPPDPTRDARLIDALLGAAALDGDRAIHAAQEDAFSAAETTGEYEARRGETRTAPPPAAAAPRQMQMYKRVAAAPPPPPAAPMGRAVSRAPSAPRSPGADTDYGEEAPSETLGGRDDLAADVARRPAAAPMYRGADKTREWAETNWWKRTPAESTAAMIEPNRLWRDLALHGAAPGFLSPHFGLAANSFAECMCALALVDLPFVPGAHVYAPDGPRLAITAGGDALVGTSQIVDGELAPGGPPLVVGQSYVRLDDRYQHVDGERVDRYVTGALAPGVVYACLVVLANPSSSRQRVSALVQIPRGSIAVGGGRATHTLDVVLEPYATHGHELAFYFPEAGTWSHFPVHVARGGAIVAAAEPRALEVSVDGAPADTVSWAHVSQRGTLEEVVAMLAGGNLAALALPRIAWRLKDRAAYEAIVGALEARHAFDATLWGYALLHRDGPRVRAWLRTLGDRLLGAGPVLDMPAVGLDAEALGAYEHLELAPLVNARAHGLGGALRILNEGLAAQYGRFLDLVAHRPAPTAEDLLAATAYLLAQDRIAAALAMLGRVDPTAVVDRMQHGYLAAYAACLVGDTARARAWAEPWRGVPIDRWRRRFEAVLALLDELAQGAPAPAPPPAPEAAASPDSLIDARGRDAQLGELAARQATFDLAVDAAGVRVRQQHVPALELRYFEMDIELLFSRQPFVASDVSRFSYIAPGHREQLVAPAPEQLVPWPAPLRGKNVVVEGVAAGRRAAKVHYANDLATTLAHQYGQVRVQRASDRSALPATYVKVYARDGSGGVAFYKDGYTDLRGWFDYATLSTDDLDRVERFAILVHSDQAGAAILEASPPRR